MKSLSASACRLSEVKVVRGASKGSYVDSKHHWGVKVKSIQMLAPFSIYQAYLWWKFCITFKVVLQSLLYHSKLTHYCTCREFTYTPGQILEIKFLKKCIYTLLCPWASIAWPLTLHPLEEVDQHHEGRGLRAGQSHPDSVRGAQIRTHLH